jgi:hypothetical protein
MEKLYFGLKCATVERTSIGLQSGGAIDASIFLERTTPGANRSGGRRFSESVKACMTRFVHGERGGTRTLDPMIKSHVLYHLSYALTRRAV